MKKLHLIIKKILELVFRIYWIFPVKNTRITLLNELSFSYGDNLKYLNEYIQNNIKKSNYEIIFPLKKICNIGPQITVVKAMSIAYFYYLLTSKVIITNAGGISYLPIRKEQYVLSTWHGGGPYKKNGMSGYGLNKEYEKELAINAEKINYMLSSCKYFDQYEAKDMLISESKLLKFGSPRNDILFKENFFIKKNVFRFYNIPPQKRIILYAPTFRSNVLNYTSAKHGFLMDIDIDGVEKWLEKKFGGEWIFALRIHPKIKKNKGVSKKILNFTQYKDMQELLCAADCLITDYSSSMWDYSFTGKPCFIYAKDIDVYEAERGFYMPSKEWPFPIARDNEQLKDNIMNFDEKEYSKHIKKHHIDSGSYENGTACEQVINFIKNCMEDKNVLRRPCYKKYD